jgi:hypothetical protein
MEKNDVKARLAYLRTSGDFSDCVLIVGSGENVEVCTVCICYILKCYHILDILFYVTKIFWMAIQNEFFDPLSEKRQKKLKLSL